MNIKTSKNITKITNCSTRSLFSFVYDYLKKDLPSTKSGKLVPAIRYQRNYIKIEGNRIVFLINEHSESKYIDYLKDKVSQYFQCTISQAGLVRADDELVSYNPTVFQKVIVHVKDWKHPSPPDYRIESDVQMKQQNLFV